MAFQEFWCLSGGSNMNGGSEGTSATAIDTAADVTSTNGAWDLDAGGGTSLFTCADTPTLVAGMVGMYAAIYKDGNTTPTANEHIVALITAIDNTAKTVTLSATKRSVLGTAIADQANGYSIKIGGAWAGPGEAVGFPFGFIAAAATDSTGDATPRVNFIGTFTVSSAMTHALAGPCQFEGCQTSAGDGLARAKIDGGSASAYRVLSVTAAGHVFATFEFTNAAASGGDYMIRADVNDLVFFNCSFHDCPRSALYFSDQIVECEFYSCSTSSASYSGAYGYYNSKAIRCTFHDNTGAGMTAERAGNVSDCIFDSNGADGLLLSGSTVGQGAHVSNCDFYGNAANGIEIANTATRTYLIENCNFVKNGTGGIGYGIEGTGSGGRVGVIRNCGFGAGTMANATGTVTGEKSIVISGSVTYTENKTPWDDPADGDFTLANVASAAKTLQARGAGRGTFPTSTQAGYGDPNKTTSKPDIGAGLRGGVLPLAEDVEDGVFYGAAGGTEYEGELPAGGGGGGPVFGDRTGGIR